MDHISRYDISIHTSGCKVNTYDSGLLEARLRKAGMQVNHSGSTTDKDVLSSGKPRVHILNTCAVTAEATRDAVKSVRRIKAREPNSTVVVTGCAAQVDGGLLDQLPAADLIVANSHKGQLEHILDQFFKGQLTDKVFRSNIFRKDDLEAGGGLETSHSRAFLKIQDGCNSFCTYCVIPFARGKSRSIGIDDLIKRVNELDSMGFKEVVLTGVHIGDYEDVSRGGNRDLSDLLEEILAKTKVPRLRLTSLEPVELSAKLMSLFANPRLCRHFHMSIQSANTRVLQAMKRKYTAEDVEESLSKIAQQVPGSFVGMDVIVGFPGETDEEFRDTYERLARLPWTRIHVFPYSERPGTKAASLEDPVPKKLRQIRSAQLRTLSSQRYREEAQRQVGIEKQTLILRSSERGPNALTSDYWPMRIQNFAASEMKEAKVRVLGFDESETSRMDGYLLGEMI